MYLSVDHIDVRTYQLPDGHPFSKSISEGEQVKPDITRHEMFLSIYVIAETCPYIVDTGHKNDKSYHLIYKGQGKHIFERKIMNIEHYILQFEH